jgi:hypothetical protein
VATLRISRARPEAAAGVTAGVTAGEEVKAKAAVAAATTGTLIKSMGTAKGRAEVAATVPLLFQGLVELYSPAFFDSC